MIETIDNSRRPALVALIVFVLAIGGLIGLSAHQASQTGAWYACAPVCPRPTIGGVCPTKLVNWYAPLPCVHY